MALEAEGRPARDLARDVIYTKITEATEVMKLKQAQDGVTASPAIRDLALAWRYLSGGPQPGGGCNCGSK